MKKKTYGELYQEFLEKMGWTGKESEMVNDYRPSGSPYIDELFGAEIGSLNMYIPNGIIVWLRDGTTMIYVGKE